MLTLLFPHKTMLACLAENNAEMALKNGKS